MVGIRIDPELAGEIHRIEHGHDHGRTIAVVIECVGEVEAGGDDDRAAGLERMEQHLHTLQRRVRERLDQLGVSRVEGSALVNALFASLTPAQINDIASHPDVRIVRLSRPEQVTT